MLFSPYELGPNSALSIILLPNSDTRAKKRASRSFITVHDLSRNVTEPSSHATVSRVKIPGLDSSGD